MSRQVATIKPLPPEVAAKIKSSVVISSPAQVVIGLLENAIDAGATKIDINVDFTRGFCSVEDDGCGIAPVDIREGGGIGKLYHTSKTSEGEQHVDRHGVFISSVASLSVLTIVSRHEKYATTNAITFHHSRPVARLLPAPTHLGIANRSHGTKVTIQDLFGNLPVRVKQRPSGDEGQRMRDRLWKSLCHAIVGVLLARARAVSLKIRGADKDQLLRLQCPVLIQRSPRNPDAPRTPQSSFDLPLIESILVQSGCIYTENWSTWTKTSARTLTMTIRAVLSKEPTPTKEVQFISIGSQIIHDNHGYNIFYEEINKQFARSSFGVREDTAASPQVGGNITQKQLKGSGKGIDRWPMFFIRVDLNNKGPTHCARSGDHEDKVQLTGILNVLHAMISSFLMDNNFRPHKRREKANPFSPRSASSPENRNFSKLSRGQSSGSPASGSSKRKSLHRLQSTDGPDDLNSKFSFPLSDKTNGTNQLSEHFKGWGRIKYGPDRRRAPKSMDETTIVPQPPELERPEPIQVQAKAIEDENEVPATEEGSGADATVTWTDPVSKDQVVINTRTGFVVEPLVWPRTANADGPSQNVDVKRLQQCRQNLARSKSDTVLAPESGSWSTTLLKDWKNPVFERSEERIPQVSLDELTIDQLYDRSRCSRLDSETTFQFSSAEVRLDKQTLQSCEVIAQVDTKFILVKVQGTTSKHAVGAHYERGDMLLLIDQHAADERVRVESLFSDLCASVDEHGINTVVLPKPISFDLQHRERKIFKTHQAHFTQWGLIYTLREARRGLTQKEGGRWILDVTKVPPAIAERCRVDPKCLVDLMRTAAWKVEGSNSHSTGSNRCDTAAGPTSWVQRLHSCPTGIIDMINSRACRSAIMFNDELTLKECEDLIRKLAKCQFPFQCAHGRPSTIPLVQLGQSDLGGIDLSTRLPVGGDNEGDFASKWKAWKKA